MRAVVLAAGNARRMRGVDKLLEPLDGRPLLRVLATRLLAAGLGPVAVTLRQPDPERDAAIVGLGVSRLPVPDADQGMSASLRAAARWAEGHDLMILPADMPELTTDDLARCRRAFDGTRPLRATAQDGTPGHPVIFPARLLPLFSRLTGDHGAQEILRVNPPRFFALPFAHATTDLDTPEAWADWRAEHPGGIDNDDGR